MVRAGNLKAGDKALVYDIWHQEGRSRSSQGVYDALTKAGLKVEKLDVSQAVDSDTSLAIPILTAYLQAHPDLKAIGTQHGSVTAILPKVLQAAGKKPGEIVCGGIDLSPATVAAIQGGWITASFDQVLYLQGYLPVMQIVVDQALPDPRPALRHGRRHRDPAEHRDHQAPDRPGNPLEDLGLRNTTSAVIRRRCFFRSYFLSCFAYQSRQMMR